MSLKPKTIGIIGGGQLGQMMALSAIEMGYKIAVLDPDENCPCKQLSNHFICAAYDDKSALLKLNEFSDVITYEFENVPITTLKEVISIEKCPQGFKALELSQDRILEKEFALSLNIPTVEFFNISNYEELNQVKKDHDYILKTRRLGYDGKGQYDLNHVQTYPIELNHNSGYILEKKCLFDAEISIAITRFKDGCTFFESSQNTHRSGILRYSISPSLQSKEVIEKAQMYTQKMVESLDYIGVFVVEYFVKDNELFFNEFAPRPHNSFHQTIESCEFSQFDTHIRAITLQRRVEPKLMSASLMVNVLGDNYDKIQGFIESTTIPIHFHWYGKTELRLKRKMGHMTILCDDPSAVIEQWEEHLC